MHVAPVILMSLCLGIICTVSKAFLKREWEQAVAANLTGDCRRAPCKGCNVCPELNTAIIDYKEGGRVEKVTFGLK